MQTCQKSWTGVKLAIKRIVFAKLFQTLWFISFSLYTTVAAGQIRRLKDLSHSQDDLGDIAIKLYVYELNQTEKFETIFMKIGAFLQLFDQLYNIFDKFSWPLTFRHNSKPSIRFEETPHNKPVIALLLSNKRLQWICIVDRNLCKFVALYNRDVNCPIVIMNYIKGV